MATYGKTWWGEKWLEAFTDIDYSNRLPRGKTYANTGRAYDIKIDKNTITAKVTGSRRAPYKVNISIEPFSEHQKNAISDIIKNSPSILSGLVNKKLSPHLFNELESRQIKLFPKKWDDLEANCSCPDWALPCKHIAAVIYLICNEIDKNPFLAFELHDCDLLSLVPDFQGGKFQVAQQILKIEDCLKYKRNTQTVFDSSVLENMDFSTIPEVSASVLAILEKNPAFSEKNLHGMFDVAYKFFKRYHITNSSNMTLMFSPQSKSVKKEEPSSEEEFFESRWGAPFRWEWFHFSINQEYQLDKILNEKEEILKDQGSGHEILLQFLCEIPSSHLHKLSPHLRFTHMLYLFCDALMQRGAMIPQILQNTQGKVVVRWRPAILIQEVRDLFQAFTSICPKDLVLYKNKPLALEEQVLAVLSLMFTTHMKNNLPTALEKHVSDDVFSLFFNGKTREFTKFGDKQIPSAINHWLSDLYLTERSHKLHIVIEEDADDFTLNVAVTTEKEDIPQSLFEFLKNIKSKNKLSILSDLSPLLHHLPLLTHSIDSGESTQLHFDDFATLFQKVLPFLKAIGVGIILPKALQKIIKPKLNLSLKSAGNIEQDRQSFLNLETLLDFEWQVAVGEKKLTPAQFKSLLKNSQGLVRMQDGYVFLDETEMSKLLKSLDKLPDKLSNADLMQGILAEEFYGAPVQMDSEIHQLFEQLKSFDPIKVPHNLRAQLRPYQERGVSWLIQNIQANFGSILADDMGLGKTLQVIAAILHLKNNGRLKRSKVLIITPTSLLSNWQYEINKFTPDLTAQVYHGTERFLSNDVDIVLTSYGLGRRDTKKLNKRKWFLLVIDEAQNIKNPSTAQTKAIKSLAASHKIAMSGTPVENRLLEYWSIFDFSNKNYLGSAAKFKNQFATPIEKGRDKKCLHRFNKVTSPFVLRRLKTDKNIIRDLPRKIENNRYCFLTPEQAALYQEVINLTMKKIEGSDGIERKGLVLKMINALKQVCNHPSQYGKKKKASIDQSGKMQVLENTISSIEASDEKALIFTQYSEMGKLMAKLLEEKFDTTFAFLHGGLSRKARDQMVDVFQILPRNQFLIVSLKAGGTGLNLTAANHVIHYDLWWNPAVEAQATDRAYRIGQQKNVMVHRFITTGTFEERIDEMIQDKKDLANLTVSSGEKWITELNNKQLMEIVSIRETEYALAA